MQSQQDNSVRAEPAVKGKGKGKGKKKVTDYFHPEPISAVEAKIDTKGKGKAVAMPDSTTEPRQGEERLLESSLDSDLAEEQF